MRQYFYHNPCDYLEKQSSHLFDCCNLFVDYNGHRFQFRSCYNLVFRLNLCEQKERESLPNNYHNIKPSEHQSKNLEKEKSQIMIYLRVKTQPFFP